MSATKTSGNGYALYNGVKLPTLPEWDKTTYPYAIVAKSDKYYLYLSEAKNYAKGSTGCIGAGAYACFTYDIGSTASAWTAADSGTLESDTGWAVAPFWSNHEIINQTDSSVFLAATSPIPLDGMTVIEWDGDTTDLAVADDAYYRVAGSVTLAQAKGYAVTYDGGALAQATTEVTADSDYGYAEIIDSTNELVAYNVYDTTTYGTTGIYLCKWDDSTYISLLAYSEAATVYEDEYSVKSAGLIATAEAIRAKTGGTGKIAWSNENGFAEAVGGISGGGLDINGVIEQYRVNAGATVNAGDFVEFVSEWEKTAFSNNTITRVSACKLDSNRVLVAYSDGGNSSYGTAVVLTIDGKSVTVGEPAVFQSESTGLIHLAALTENKVLVGYTRAYTISCAVLSVAGSAIIVGTETVVKPYDSDLGIRDFTLVSLSKTRAILVYAGAGYGTTANWRTAYLLGIDGGSITTLKSTNLGSSIWYKLVGCKLDDAHVLIAYSDGGNSSYGKAQVLTIDGTSITVGTAAVFESASIGGMSLAALTENKAIVAYSDGGNSSYGTAVVLTIDGESVTVGEPAVFRYASSGYAWQLAALTENKAIVAYSDGGNSSYGKAQVLTIDGTSITAGTAVVFESASISYCAVTAFASTSVLSAYATSTAGLFNSLTIDGTTITASDTTKLGTFVQPATSRLHNVGVAKTGGTQSSTVDVYMVTIPHCVIIDAENATADTDTFTLYAGETATVIVTPDLYYQIDEVDVVGGQYEWDATAGKLTLIMQNEDIVVTVKTSFAGQFTSSAKETTSSTALTSSVDCNVGDLVVAAIATRDTLTLSDGWTLVSTSEINSTDDAGNGQRLSWAWKFAESTTETITVTQASAQRLYINMVALKGATGVTDNGYSYRDDTTSASMTVAKPSGLVLWGLTAPLWDTNTVHSLWTASNDMPLVQLGSDTQPRLAIGLDQSDDESVTFTGGSSSTMIVGSLTVQGMDKFYTATPFTRNEWNEI